jgi:alanyl-tRNA synthetase
MKHSEIREKFQTFMESRGHRWVSSSPLLPDDPSVLFTTAGMQQFKPYYTGAADAQHDFNSLSTASVQKCVRTGDIDEVGDERHLTFFEMLGNFSFGGYFKREAIQYAYDFVVKEMGLKIEYVTVFGGNDAVPADTESEEIWKSLDPSLDVRKFGVDDNLWGPTGTQGPCGPTTEIFVDGIEIWNVVFNQFFYPGSREELLSGTSDKKLEPLPTPGIDTGMGLERLALVSQFPGKAGETTVFETDLFTPLMATLPEQLPVRTRRIIADHARAIVFMICDGVLPSNKDQGYVLRRLMRRILVHAHLHKLSLRDVLNASVSEYQPYYPNLNTQTVADVFTTEAEKFSKTLEKGLRELEKVGDIDAVSAFRLYESYGLPYEILKELGGDKAQGLTREAFDTKFKEHQEKSRAGAEKKFGGHGLLLDTGELKAADEAELAIVTRLHTATHLLQAALRKVLGDGVSQAGSDITAERLRFDFTFSRKMTDQEIQQVQDLVNDVIARDLPVTKQTLPQEEALKTGALHFFKIKYPPMVDVYTVGTGEEWFSREFCGGPHVEHTGVIGGLKITKEEGVVSQGGFRATLIRVRATRVARLCG